jgi:hypothetical protein
MARDLFIDLTNRRLVASETNSAPVGLATFTKGDNGAFNLYFLEATGVINRPFEVVDKSSTSVKLGIGSRLGVPETGTYTLTFGGDTTSALDAAATAGAIQTALNGLAAISSAGGVSVTGELADHFTVRFNDVGAQGSFTADVSQLIPDTAAVIDERIAGSASVKEIQEIQLRLTPAVFQDSWADLGTTVTATIATTVTGSNEVSEVQRLSFSREPFAGSYRLTAPSAILSPIVGVSNGIFTYDSSVNHGLALNQPIFLDAITNGTVTGYNSGETYFVKTIPQPFQFGVSVAAGGTLITGSGESVEFNFQTITRQTAPISAAASAADVQAALQALDSIGASGVIVTGIQGEYFDITFSGTKGQSGANSGVDTAIVQLSVQNGTTAKPGKTADVNFATFALRDLLGNNPAVDLDLELELTESGTRQTVILQPCSVAEELIDADSFSPTSGYPSFIFQALTSSVTNSNPSFVAITALNWNAQANSEYLVQWSIIAQSQGGSDPLQGLITVPTGSELYGKWNKGTPETSIDPTSVNLITSGDFYGLSSDECQITQVGYLKTALTGGTVEFNYQSNGGNDAVIFEGSWVRAEKVK